MIATAEPFGPFDRSGLHAVNRLMIDGLRRPAELHLDGIWRFQLLASDTSAPSELWTDVTVPGLWTMWSDKDRPNYTNVPMPFDDVFPSIPADNPVGLFRREFEFSPPVGRRTVLHVGAAEGYLRVTVNGTPIGTSGDSHLAAEFDITDALVEGTNTLDLAVSKWSSATYLEDQDQWWQSGISRSVHLYSVGEIRLADVSVVADFDPVSRRGRLRLVASTFGLKHLDAVDHTIRVRAVGEETTAQVGPRLPTTMMPPPARDRSIRPEQRFPEDFMDTISLTAADAPPPPELRANPHAGGEVTVPEFPAGTVVVEFTDLHVAPWSAESPHLEAILVELLDGSGVVVDSASFRTGFRRVQVVGRDLLVNGEPILFQGVNRHDVDPHSGRVMTRERFLAELSLLKRFNVNAIRTSHYPNDPVFLDLCDELGFYVVDEADVEGHAFASTIADDPLYLPEIVERVSRMVIRDRNHPSVIIWSLGNETGYGAAHDAAAAWVRHFEPTRPVQYEGAVSPDWHKGHAASDITCPMYPSFASITAYAAHPKADRPLIFCEYAYSQGNSTGGFDEYWRLFESLPGVQGGFIWEFMDHTLDPDGDGRLRYGGDFGDPGKNGQTVLNGIVGSDLTPRPAFYEIRSVFSPVRIVSDADAAATGRLRLRNRQTFVDLSAFEFAVQVSQRHGESRQHRIEIPPTAAGEEITVPLPLEVVAAIQRDASLALTVTVRTKETTVWAEAGTVIAEQQMVLPSSKSTIIAPGRAASLDPVGDIRHPALARAPRLSLWRALTDNELSYALDQRFVRSGFFRLDLIDQPAVSTEEAGTVVVTRYRTAFDDEVTHTRSVTETSDGHYLFAERVALPPGTRDGLRVGMEFELVPGFDTASWVGLGPWENYPDRRSGALLGRWSSSIDDLAVPYLRPQENGTRGGVTELTITGPAGSVEISTDVPVHVNVARHTADELEAATHWWKLPESRKTVVHVDIAQRGVGTGRIGPDTRPTFRLAGDHYAWSWRMRIEGRQPIARPRVLPVRS